MWDRLRKRLALPQKDNQLVRDWENWYASRPDYVTRMTERGGRYLFHIAEEIERRNMPAEIALLPMIESAFNPQAYSRAHASGIWQFIPSTGKHYGLKQNWWYDGRRDIIAATNAALDYLERLHGMFGNWELALASYNWGEGAVSRAISRNQARGLPADYDSLTMPAETRNYLPKLIAVRNIIADPARFGLKLPTVPNEPYFEVVTVQRHIDVKLAAKFADMTIEEFRFLNPAHNKPVIKAGSAETIVLPRHRVGTFRANFANHDKPMVTWQAHVVKPGEKPETIAAKHGMTLTQLKEVNNIRDRKQLAPGKPLLVQMNGATAEPHLPDLPAAQVAKAKPVKVARNTKGQRTAARPTKKTTVARAPGNRVKVSVQPKSKPVAKRPPAAPVSRVAKQ